MDNMGKTEHQMHNNSLPKLINTKDVAEWLDISRERVYSLCATHQFPNIKISRRRVRYSVDDIKTWLSERGWNGK